MTQTGQDKIWKVIRNLRDFTSFDVQELTGTTPGNIRTYICCLQRAGYVRQTGSKNAAYGPKLKVWRLIKNTGPKAPQLRRCLYDPNNAGLTEVKSNVD